MEPLVYDECRLKLFDEALQALLSTLQPTPDSDAARRQVVSDMQAVVAEVMPKELHCSVETFGSFRAGLHLPGSDLDFAVTAWVQKAKPMWDDTFGNEDGQQQQELITYEVHEWPQLEQQYLLKDLADALEAKGLVQGQVERVLHARVPVIKCVHKATGLACDFSCSRPECAFKAEMQKLLVSIDRRYAALYRLVKMWAAAHGLNDAASNTLNSWSLGLMVAFYLQCEQPAVLPPIWQLLERQAPHPSAPRILQNRGINSAALKRMLSLAATGAGAYISKRNRQGVNQKSLGELLAGFFELFADQMSHWVEGFERSRRCSTWWGSWMDASWPASKPYIFGIEDPFHAEDNTARSVGTHNHLNCRNSARYIAWAVATSAKLLRDAFNGRTAAAAAQSRADIGDQQRSSIADAAAVPGSPGNVSLADWVDGGCSSSTATAAAAGSTVCSTTDSNDAVNHQIMTAFVWIFGPEVLKLRQQLPLHLQQQIEQQIDKADLAEITSELTSLGDCSAALSNSSSLGCCDSNNSCLGDPQKLQQIEQALDLFARLMVKLDAQQKLPVCMGAYQQQRRLEMQQRWQQSEHERDTLHQGLAGLRVGSAPADLQSQPPRQQRRRQQQQQQQWHESRSTNDVVSAALQPVGAMAVIQSCSGRSNGREQRARHSSNMLHAPRAQSMPAEVPPPPPLVPRSGSTHSQMAHPAVYGAVPAAGGAGSNRSTVSSSTGHEVLRRQLSGLSQADGHSSHAGRSDRRQHMPSAGTAVANDDSRGAVVHSSSSSRGRGRGGTSSREQQGQWAGSVSADSSTASSSITTAAVHVPADRQQQQRKQQRARPPHRGGPGTLAAAALAQVGLHQGGVVGAAQQ